MDFRYHCVVSMAVAGGERGVCSFCCGSCMRVVCGCVFLWCRSYFFSQVYFLHFPLSPERAADLKTPTELPIHDGTTRSSTLNETSLSAQNWNTNRSSNTCALTTLWSRSGIGQIVGSRNSSTYESSGFFPRLPDIVSPSSQMIRFIHSSRSTAVLYKE